MPTATIPTLTLNNGVEMPAFGLGVFQSPPDETTNAVWAASSVGAARSTRPPSPRFERRGQQQESPS